MKTMTAEEPNELLSVDLFGPPSKSVFGMSQIVVVIDVFTKHTKLYPIKSATANSCIRQVAKFIDLYAPAKKILTDNGSQFTSHMWEDHWAAQGVKLRLTSIYTRNLNTPDKKLFKIIQIFGFAFKI